MDFQLLRNVFLLGSFLLSVSLFATDPQMARFVEETCDQTIVDRGNGYYSVREPLVFQSPDELTHVLQKVQGSEGSYFEFYNATGTYRLFAELRSVQDFVVYQEDLWVLSDGNILLFNREGILLESYRMNHNGRNQKPHGLTLREETLLIAHGTLGLIQFDLLERDFTFLNGVYTWQEDGRKSRAVAVTQREDLVYVALSTVSRDSFNGVVVYDLIKDEIVNTAKYRNRREGVIDSRAKIYLKDDSAFLNNGGWIHRLNLRDLEARSIARPAWMSISYPFENRNRFLMIRGDFYFSQGEIIGCALNERLPVVARRRL